MPYFWILCMQAIPENTHIFPHMLLIPETTGSPRSHNSSSQYTLSNILQEHDELKASGNGWGGH